MTFFTFIGIYSVIGAMIWVLAHDRGHRDTGIPCTEPVHRMAAGILTFSLAWPLILLLITVLFYSRRLK